MFHSHAVRRLLDLALPASWIALISLAVVDAVVDEDSAASPPAGLRALLVTLVACMTITRAVTKGIERICGLLAVNGKILQQMRDDQTTIYALGEEAGFQRAMHLHHQAHSHHHRHRPLAVYDRDKGWVG